MITEQDITTLIGKNITIINKSLIFISFIVIFSCNSINKTDSSGLKQGEWNFYENGYFKKGKFIDDEELGLWIWKDSITGNEEIKLYYFDSLLNKREQRFIKKSYLSNGTEYTNELLLDDKSSQIIRLRVIDTFLYKQKLTYRGKYIEAGQGIYLFNCINCHNMPKAKNSLVDYEKSALIDYLNNDHVRINGYKLRDEEIIEIYNYLNRYNLNNK